MKKLWNAIKIPFVILYIRYIQYKQRVLSTKQGNSNTNKLIIFQSLEYYYKQEFESWGKYHNGKFSYSSKEWDKHIRFINWLFPDKDYKQSDIVIRYNPEAVTYYINLIYRTDKEPRNHTRDIPIQLKKWKEERNKKDF